MESKHFKEEVYAQFVAGCLPEEDLREFQEHLGANCQVCTAMVERYERLSDILREDPTYEPPAASVKSVLNAFRLKKPETVNLVSVMANLVFDSFLQPLPAGVRQTLLTERQVLYQAGEMHLDLKIEKTNDEDACLIVGQLMPQDSRQDQPVPVFKAILREGNRTLQATYSNELGEFVFHVVPKKSYDLEILLTDSKKIFLTRVPTTQGVGSNV